MQTHDDNTHTQIDRFLEELHRRAEKSKESMKSQITTGSPDEKPLAQWKGNGIQVCHMPDDPQNILRISIGGGEKTPVVVNYCTIRGGVGECIALLEKAIKALKESPE